MVCTQPRRISAIGVAERVAAERCGKVGGQVGYQIRLESKKSKDTRLLFCTTGLLLRRLMDDRDLSGVSHVVVDEVHERTIDGDFLLILLRRLVRRRPDLRVILMSATADADKFSAYFGGCPVVTIPGFTHPVECFHLEDALKATGQLIGRGSPYALPRDAFIKRKKAFEASRGGEPPPAILPQEGGEEEEEDPPDGQAAAADEGGGVGEERLDHVAISLINVDESQVNYDLIEGLLEHFHRNSAALDGGGGPGVHPRLPPGASRDSARARPCGGPIEEGHGGAPVARPRARLAVFGGPAKGLPEATGGGEEGGPRDQHLRDQHHHR